MCYNPHNHNQINEETPSKPCQKLLRHIYLKTVPSYVLVLRYEVVGGPCMRKSGLRVRIAVESVRAISGVRVFLPKDEEENGCDHVANH